MRKSTLMSNAGEKERTKFFNTLRERVESRIKAVWSVFLVVFDLVSQNNGGGNQIKSG